MVHPLVGIHAALGEVGIFSFLWVFVELLNPTEKRVNRAKTVALIGVIFLVLAWIVGGYYYVTYYGAHVKPVIKAGPAPWGHTVFTETKEHIFLFLPFLAFLAYAFIRDSQKEILKNAVLNKSVLALCLLIVLIGLAMAGMGYSISATARIALEAVPK